MQVLKTILAIKSIKGYFCNMRAGFLLNLVLLLGFAGFGQTVLTPKPEKNLVPNGSFENYRRKSGDVRKAVPWRPIETIDFYQNYIVVNRKKLTKIEDKKLIERISEIKRLLDKKPNG